MAESSGNAPPGWYYAPGDPLGTQRYWDGRQWVGGPQWVPQPPTGYAVPGRQLPGLDRTLADPGRRIVARIIDAILVGLVSSVPIVAVLSRRDELDFEHIQRWSLLTVAATAVYEIVLIALKGATVGKMAMGIEVIRQDGTSPPGWTTAFLRYVVELVGVIPVVGGAINLVVFVVSFVFLFTDERRRTVNDRIATTYVVNARSKTPNW